MRDPTSGCLPGTALVCSDSNPCNGQELCDAQAGCTSGTPAKCSDGDACNGLETCDTVLGCQPGPAPVCHDSNPCNGDEYCTAALGCVDGPPLACSDGDPCNGAESCDPAIGCQPGLPACDDGNACNGAEGCDSVVGCLPGTVPTCDDGEPCNGAEGCDPALGCAPGAALDCDDSDACTDDACIQGLGCQHGAKSCDDGDPCTADGCSAATGCTHDPGLAQGLSCTPEDPCFVTGACQGGTCVGTLAADCDDENPCTADGCDTGAGGCLHDGDPADGLPCGDYPGVTSACAAGVCVHTCDDGLGDCDGDLASGCETNLAVQPAHCGDCATECGDFEVCSAGDCADQCAGGLQACGGGCVDLLTHPEHCGGCFDDCAPPNAQGACVGGTCTVIGCKPGFVDVDAEAATGCECLFQGPEKCDGEDDDCDGLVDDGFDLSADPEHCGSCLVDCDEAAKTLETTCVGGNCDVVTCEPGFKDADGLASSGCETPVDVWWVDAAGTAEEPDGSFAKPFLTIQEALDLAQPQDEVRIRAGSYAGDIGIHTPQLRIFGEGMAQTTILDADGGTNVIVAASGVQLFDMTLSGGSRGLWFRGEPSKLLLGGRAERVRVVDIQHPTTDVHGILAEHTPGVQILDAEVSDVAAGSEPATAGHGADATGISIIASPGATVSGCTVSGIVGQSATGNPGPRGGAARGISVRNPADGVVVSGNSVSSLTGGGGNFALNNYGRCLHVDVSPDAIDVALDNTCDGVPIVLLIGKSDLVLSGIHVPAGTWPTSLGAIVIRDGTNITLENSSVIGWRNVPGSSADGIGGEGVPAISLTGCEGCLVDGLVVQDVRGGTAGEDTSGGNGIALTLSDCTDTTAQGLEISGVVGGGWTGSVSTSGGSGIGVLVASSTGTVVRDSRLRDLSAAHLKGGYPGGSHGVYVSASAETTVSHVLATDLKPGTGASVQTKGYARGAFLYDAPGTLLDHVTIWDLNPDDNGNNQPAIAVYGTSDLVLSNSIVGEADFIVRNKTATGAAAVVVRYSMWYEFKQLTAFDGEVTLDAGNQASKSPQFADPIQLTLLPASPAIDAADPDAPYCLEPSPNGCRANLGAWGNTPKATVWATEPTDCPCE